MEIYTKLLHRQMSKKNTKCVRSSDKLIQLRIHLKLHIFSLHCKKKNKQMFHNPLKCSTEIIEWPVPYYRRFRIAFFIFRKHYILQIWKIILKERNFILIALIFGNISELLLISFFKWEYKFFGCYQLSSTFISIKHVLHINMIN